MESLDDDVSVGRRGTGNRVDGEYERIEQF